MAKKSRTPPPPRPVQAPKLRTEPRDPKRTRLLLAALAGALVVAAAGVGIAFALTGGDGGGGGGGDGQAAACKTQTFPGQGAEHVAKAKKGFEYNSFPPTSGPHYGQPDGPAVWDVYDRPVDQLALIHNLEHGGIVVQYGERVRPATVNEIVAWYREDPNGMVVAPLPRLGDKIALTAWRNLATCSRFDEDAFSSFRDEHRFKGPERFPPELLQPGQQ